MDPMFLTVPFQLGIFYDCVTPSAVRRLSPVWGGRGRTPRHHNSLPNSAGPGGRGRTCPGCSRGGPAVIPTPFYTLPILHLPHSPASPQPSPGSTAGAFKEGRGGGGGRLRSDVCGGGIAPVSPVAEGEARGGLSVPCPRGRPAPANDSILQLSVLARRAPPARSPPPQPRGPPPEAGLRGGPPGTALTPPSRGHSRNCRRRRPPGTARRRRRRARRRSPCGAPSPRRR